MKTKSNLKGILILTLTALIWGVAFVAQSDGAAHLSPYTFMFLRYPIGGMVLLPLIFFRDRKLSSAERRSTWRSKTLILGGILCGTALLLASLFQQLGFTDPQTTSGKAAFITALYILFVPCLERLLGKRVPWAVWICVLIAGCGMYLLCLYGTVALSRGDLYELICAVLFSVHILIVDRFAPKTDCVKLSCIQFFTAGILGGVIVLFTGMSSLSDILAGLIPLLYVGVMSSGVAYTLQIVGQKYTDPAVAPLVMSLESVFAALSGWLLRSESMRPHELIGCALIFAAIVFTQLPWKRRGGLAISHKT